MKLFFAEGSKSSEVPLHPVVGDFCRLIPGGNPTPRYRVNSLIPMLVGFILEWALSECSEGGR